MNKIESFIYACLPALLILIFSEVAVFLADGQVALTMCLLGLFYFILIWWLYVYTQGKIMMKVVEEKKKDLTVAAPATLQELFEKKE